ncbi:MAG TPA: FtsL-like putative cell division protein [Anseongella sp.]
MNKVREEKETVKQAREENRPGRNFLTILFSGEWISRERALEILPFLLFLALLALIYISDRHYAEDVARDINKGATELKELRWEYITAKAELMHLSQQSQVAERAAELGLQESVIPPVKIKVSDEDKD